MPPEIDAGGLAFFLVGLVVFWLVVHLLNRTFSLEKYGINISSIFVKYESRRFKDFLYRTSQKHQKIWKVFSNLSVAVGMGLLFFAFYFLTENLFKFFAPGGQGSPVVPVVPGLTIRLYWLPYFAIAFLVAVITHEFAHGVVAIVEGIRIKSAGLFFALVQPGGFVEPDQKELEAAPTVSKLRVLSAGSSMNLLVGILVFLALSVFFFRTPSGIVVMDVLHNGPLENAGVHRWDVLFAINGTRISSMVDLEAFMANVTPGERLFVATNRGEVVITTARHPSKSGKAIIGITASMPYFKSRADLDVFWDTQFFTTLNWMFILLVNLAVMNMLPIPFLDGDRFLQYFFQRYAKDRLLRMLFNAFSLFLIVANMMLTFGSNMFSF